MFYVIQPIMDKSQPDWAESATIISRHHRRETAEQAIGKAIARLRRQPGMQHSWLDWYVVEGSQLSARKRARK